MKTAIITIAGLSSRFNKGLSLGEYRLKAIYYEDSAFDTLLYHMLKKLDDIDKIILVAGYKQTDLLEYIENALPHEMKNKITVILNDHYEDWSSGYSLYIGINEALKYESESVLFAEGDLDVDDESFHKITSNEKSVITCNHEIIKSNKAVVGYCNAEGKYKYVFSASHGLVSIDDSFSLLFNSGQIWKFTDMKILREANNKFEQVKETGTNLIIVSNYFEKEDPENIELIDFKRWVNCNTRDDYHMICDGWEAEQ